MISANSCLQSVNCLLWFIFIQYTHKIGQNLHKLTNAYDNKFLPLHFISTDCDYNTWVHWLTTEHRTDWGIFHVKYEPGSFVHKTNYMVFPQDKVGKFKPFPCTIYTMDYLSERKCILKCLQIKLNVWNLLTAYTDYICLWSNSDKLVTKLN